MRDPDDDAMEDLESDLDLREGEADRYWKLYHEEMQRLQISDADLTDKERRVMARNYAEGELHNGD